MYIKIIIVAIGILLLFRAFSFLNRILPFSKKTKHYSGYILPILELFTWLGFTVWCLRLIYQAEVYTTLIILGIIIILLTAPAWSLVRNFLYGMLLKIQRKIEVDSKIEIGDVSGVIVKADYFTFDIKTKNGNIDTIPYNKISSEVISRNAANINLEKHAILFNIPSREDMNKILPMLKTSLVNAPWTAASQEPIINKISGEKSNYKVEVIVYIIHKEHAAKIADYVQKNFIDILS